MGTPATAVLSVIGAAAASTGRVRKGGFVLGALRDLAVCVRRGNGRLYRLIKGRLARALGRDFLAEASRLCVDFA